MPVTIQGSTGQGSVSRGTFDTMASDELRVDDRVTVRINYRDEPATVTAVLARGQVKVVLDNGVCRTFPASHVKRVAST